MKKIKVIFLMVCVLSALILVGCNSVNVETKDMYVAHTSMLLTKENDKIVDTTRLLISGEKFCVLSYEGEYAYGYTGKNKRYGYVLERNLTVDKPEERIMYVTKEFDMTCIDSMYHEMHVIKWMPGTEFKVYYVEISEFSGQKMYYGCANYLYWGYIVEDYLSDTEP